MKILITGATGYVGNKLALTLAERDNDVQVLVRNPYSVHVPVHKNIRVFAGDITNRESITEAIEECEQVYHTAALVKIFSRQADHFYKVNVEGTYNLLTKAVEAGVKKFVFTSSCGVIGPTLNYPKCENDERIAGFDNDYEYTKFLAEEQVKEFAGKGLLTVIASLSKVYGPGIETHPYSVNRVIHKFLKGNPAFIPWPGNLATNYCFIDDVVEGHILAMENGIRGEKYILGGENISYTDLFQTIRSLSGTKARIIQTPKFFVELWAAMQWLQYKISGKEPFVTKKAIRTIFCNKTFSNDKAIRQLGYQVTPIKDGLQQTIQFFKTEKNA